ncbi:ATP-binding cassette domain-containing protein [Aeromonas dhakensis]
MVGGSGSGKSTLARLLLRLYQPEQGEIFIDGQPICQLPLHHLRQQMGVVLQENHLFNKSVRDNIAQSVPHASLDQIIRAATLAGAHDFILRLPLAMTQCWQRGQLALRRPAPAPRHRPHPAGRPQDPHLRRGHQRPRR